MPSVGQVSGVLDEFVDFAKLDVVGESIAQNTFIVNSEAEENTLRENKFSSQLFQFQLFIGNFHFVNVQMLFDLQTLVLINSQQVNIFELRMGDYDVCYGT